MTDSWSGQVDWRDEVTWVFGEGEDGRGRVSVHLEMKLFAGRVDRTRRV
jgi:hypothetical protein